MDKDNAALKKKIWKTKGSRFNAYRRHLLKHNVLVYVTSISSIHLITLSIFQLSSIVELTNQQSQWLNFISIVTAIVILVYGLIEGGKNHGLLAENFHLCGKEISALLDKLDLLLKNNNEEELDVLSEEYNNVLAKYPNNHSTADYEYFLSEHPHEFDEYRNKRLYSKIKIWYSYKALDLTLAIIFICVPIILSVYIIIFLGCSN